MKKLLIMSLLLFPIVSHAADPLGGMVLYSLGILFALACIYSLLSPAYIAILNSFSLPSDAVPAKRSLFLYTLFIFLIVIPASIFYSPGSFSFVLYPFSVDTLQAASYFKVLLMFFMTMLQLAVYISIVYFAYLSLAKSLDKDILFKKIIINFVYTVFVTGVGLPMGFFLLAFIFQIGPE